MKIIAKVDDQHIVITAGANISNSVNLYTVNYNFSGDWEEYEKIACFEYTDPAISDKQVAYVTITENEAVVPWEALQTAGYIRLGVYGIKDTKKKPTVWSQPLSVIQGCRLGDDIDPQSSTYADLIKRISGKQDTLTAGKNIIIEDNVISSTGGGSDLEAGDNITIKDGVISATDTTYTAGDNVTISADNVISATDTIYDDTTVKADIETNAEVIETHNKKILDLFDSINTESETRLKSDQSLSEAINAEVSGREKAVTDIAQQITDEIERATAAEESKQNKLTAGNNITITGDVISSTDTVYDDTAIKTQITDLQGSKQDTLTAGDGIDIAGNVIKCTVEGKTYTAGTGIAISEDGVISCTFEDGNGVSY